MSTYNMCSTQTLGLFKCVIVWRRLLCVRTLNYLCVNELKMNIMIYDIQYFSLDSPHISTTLI